MKKRSYKFYLRKLHRYLGVFLGIQFLFWTLGGLYFSWTNIKEIRGDHLRQKTKAMKPLSELASPQAAIDEITAKSGEGIEKIELISLFGEPYYSIRRKLPNGAVETLLASAEAGKIRGAISEAEAGKIAMEALKEPREIIKAEFLTAENASAHHEYREKPLPAWAISFSGQESLVVYVSAQTGEIGAFRTASWRIFDFLWMLHTMGFEDRDDINNYLLRAFSVLGLITIFSGFALFFVSSRFFRRKGAMLGK